MDERTEILHRRRLRECLEPTLPVVGAMARFLHDQEPALCDKLHEEIVPYLLGVCKQNPNRAGLVCLFLAVFFFDASGLCQLLPDLEE